MMEKLWNFCIKHQLMEYLLDFEEIRIVAVGRHGRNKDLQGIKPYQLVEFESMKNKPTTKKKYYSTNGRDHFLHKSTIVVASSKR